MRQFFGSLVVLLLAAVAVWALRPSGFGDPAGLIALADQTFPAAAELRKHYLPTAEAKSEDKAKGAGDRSGTGGNRSGASAGRSGGAGRGGPAVVVTQAVTTKSVPVTFQGIGTVEAIASIPIRPRLDSQILAVGVAEGSLVAKDDLLFRLDDRALKAQLAQSTAQIQKDQTVLDQATRDLARAQDLLKKKFLNQQSLETALNAVASAKAQLAVDAALRSATETSLSFTEIRAPVAGRIGSIAAKAGAFARSGDVLATVNQIDPIYVAFALPQARLGDLRVAMSAGAASLKITNAADIPAGSIAFIENSVDASTGTVKVKASMPNAAEKLWPGTFSPIELTTGVDEDVVVVPSNAVLIGQSGPYVFVVADKRAVLKPIKVARAAGSVTIVESGVAVGDEVVVQGQGNLTDGAEVRTAKDAKDLKTSAASTSKDG